MYVAILDETEDKGDYSSFSDSRESRFKHELI